MSPESFTEAPRVRRASAHEQVARQLIDDLIGPDHRKTGPVLVAGPGEVVTQLARDISAGLPDRTVVCLIEDDQPAPNERGNLRYVSMQLEFARWLEASYERAQRLPQFHALVEPEPERLFSGAQFDTVVAIVRDHGQSPRQCISPLHYYDHLTRQGRFVAALESRSNPGDRLEPEGRDFLYRSLGVSPLHWRDREFWVNRLQDVRDNATEELLRELRQPGRGYR